MFSTVFEKLNTSLSVDWMDRSLIALNGTWNEHVIIFSCAYFISEYVAIYFAFNVVQPRDIDR